MEIKKKPVLATDPPAETPPQTPVKPVESSPFKPEEDPEKRMDRLMRMAELRMMEKLAGGGGSSIPTSPSISTGISPLKKSMEQVKDTLTTAKEMGELLKSYSPNPDPWMQILNSQFGAGLGVAVGRIVEGGISAYQARQQAQLEIEKMKLKGEQKPAASQPAGFDMFGGGESTPQQGMGVVLSEQDKELLKRQDEKIAQLTKLIEMQALQLQGVGEQLKRIVPRGQWKYTCKKCSHSQVIDASNEMEATGIFRSHLSTHPDFTAEAQKLAREGGLSPEKVSEFAGKWTEVIKVG